MSKIEELQEKQLILKDKDRKLELESKLKDKIFNLLGMDKWMKISNVKNKSKSIFRYKTMAFSLSVMNVIPWFSKTVKLLSPILRTKEETRTINVKLKQLLRKVLPQLMT